MLTSNNIILTLPGQLLQVFPRWWYARPGCVHVHVCVCVCMCVRARARVRGKVKGVRE